MALTSGEPHAAAARPSSAARKRRLIALLALLGVVAAGAILWRGAWKEASLRQLYTDELQIEAARNPTDPSVTALLGARLAASESYDEAAYYLSRAAASGRREERLWRVWAACLAAREQPEKARAVLQKAASGGCDSPEAARKALTRLDALPAKSDRLAQARAICPEGPQGLSALVGRGSFLNALSDWKEGRTPERSGFAYRERRSIENPDDPITLALWADALRRNGFLRDAEAVALRAVELAPDSPDTHKILGDVLMSGALYGKASQEYRKALDLRPDWVEPLVGLGKAAFQVQANEIALERLEAAVRVDPSHVEAWLALGRTYFRQGMRYDKSLEAYRKVQALAPERTDYYPYLADTLIATTRFSEAEQVLRRRIAVAPRDPMTHYALATFLLNQQRTPARAAEAEQLLRTSLEIQPNVPAAKIRLAEALLDKPGPEAAAEAGVLLSEALEATPYDTSGLRLAVVAYARIGRKDRVAELQKLLGVLGEKEKRIRVLEEQQLKRPTDQALYAELATLYDQVGKEAKAKRQREVLYVLKNHPERAAKGLKKLIEATSQHQPSTSRDESGAAPSPQRGEAPGDTVK